MGTHLFSIVERKPPTIESFYKISFS